MSVQLTVEQLDTRYTPTAVNLGSGYVMFDGGRLVQPFENWTGGLAVYDTGNSVWVGAGVGGGPRVAVFDKFGDRTRGDWFAGDPESRTGVVFVVPDPPPAVNIGAPHDLERLGLYLKAQSESVPDWAWNRVRDEIKGIPAGVWWDLARSNTALSLTWGVAITDIPQMSMFKGQRATTGELFDTIPGVGVPFVVNLKKAFDEADRSLSKSVLRHEIAHAWELIKFGQTTEESAERLALEWRA